ncbi:hypothetical protein BS47DRAFT_1350657 [Hydnum rufescens UP504]|uniref:Uncharacterized protein n=1 Tax=Hydnum rufescens UP504 TaxID=1448309 RepID=A0A9P6DR98_9AGAM|nr:hypothetical protein BS47DRAFT_1350657 [Hydnum rufescens UP504]
MAGTVTFATTPDALHESPQGKFKMFATTLVIYIPCLVTLKHVYVEGPDARKH